MWVHVPAEERASFLVCMLAVVLGAGLGRSGQDSVREVRQAWGSLDSVAGEISAHSLDGAGECHWTCTCQWIFPVYHRPVESSWQGCLGCWHSDAGTSRVSLCLLVALGICAGAGTVLAEDDVVFVIIILQLPKFLGILAGLLVQERVYRKLPSSFIWLKALEVSE